MEKLIQLDWKKHDDDPEFGKNRMIYEYSAKKVKQSLTGNGNAHKDQVKFMVKNLLKLKTPPKSNDSSDALAIALCYTLQSKINEL